MPVAPVPAIKSSLHALCRDGCFSSACNAVACLPILVGICVVLILSNVVAQDRQIVSQEKHG